MSWHFLPELVGGSSADISRDSEPWEPLKLNLIVEKSSCGASGTACFRCSRFGMTSGRSTATAFVDGWISSLADSPARIYLPPVAVKESKAKTADSGKKWPGSLASFDPASRSWRTAQCSLFEGLELFSETWPRSGMTRSGIAYQLPPSAPLTDGTESGYWRTPDTGKGGTSGLLKEGKDRRENGQPIQIRLVDQVNNPRLWPTPKASPSGPDFARINRPQSGGDDLATAVAREEGGPLNPPWVEWLMGFPIGWTDLVPLGTPKFQEWSSEHGKR